MRIVLSVNTAWNIANFRSGLIRGLMEAGHEVVAIAPVDESVSRIERLGCRFVELPMDNKGTNPAKDLSLFVRYRKLLQRERPDVFLGFTIKPNVYGSLAAHSLGIHVINNVSGLGTAFIRDNWITWVVKKLYKTALSRSKVVFFQNGDDSKLFLDAGLVNKDQIKLLPGSGIDLQKFRPVPLPASDPKETVTFLLMARLLYDKGIGEYATAADMLLSRGCNVRFQLLGFLDVENRTAIARKDIDQWKEKGLIDYLGTSEDVRPFIADADCVVLPSYREGTPRSLLEGAAMARPLIATDVPGCREVVDDGETGYLCEVRNAAELADRMLDVANATPEQRTALGNAGRLKMEHQFDERLVIDHYLDTIGELSKTG